MPLPGPSWTFQSEENFLGGGGAGSTAASPRKRLKTGRRWPVAVKFTHVHGSTVSDLKMTDSWEDIPTTVPSKSPEEAHKPKSSALNPKAPSFSFSPSAQEFKPTSVATPPAGFELPTYPPPSGSKIVESQPPASRPAAVPSSIASEPVIPPKPEVAADRQQNDAQVQAEKSGDLSMHLNPL